MRAENRQTHTLFGVAAIFIVGHSLRIALNIQELHWLVSGRGGGGGTEAEHDACERKGSCMMFQIAIINTLGLQP